MTPKERVMLALAHKEADRVPVGEFAIDYKLIEAVLGRETFLRGKTKYIKALWAGRRDEVVECMKKDLVEFTLKTGLDMVAVNLVPGKNQKFDVPRQIDDYTWEDRAGNILRYSDATEDIMVFREGTKPVPPEVRKEFAPDPNDESRWELLRYVVEKLGKTHYVFARPGGGFILASSHSVMIACKYDNFMAMLDMAYTEGRYPIAV